jgi:FAD/FMN-containing dehydrogenase
MAGPLLLPGDDQFESLRIPAMSRYASPRPQAIARCAGPTDVARVVTFARRLGLETAVRGAGHSFADHSSTSGLLLETGLMNTVAVNDDLATGVVPSSLRSIESSMITAPPSRLGAARQ